MEYNLSSLKTATDKIYQSVKSGIGIVHKNKENIANKITEIEGYHQQQRNLDNEIEGQLNIMYKISMQLQTKKVEIKHVFEKYDPKHSRLEIALESLKHKNIDESLVQQSPESETTNKSSQVEGENIKITGKGDVINSGSTASNEDENKKSKDSQEESKEKLHNDELIKAPVNEKLETLHDFVDIETIKMYRSSFLEHLNKLSSIRDVLEPMITKLLASINNRIYEVKTYQNKLVFEYKTIKEK